ncbi:MAG: tryptophan synthase subunit alpha [Deltaproteobacteria bacterium]|nr:tryptophan synthase subunit alpha [Deltaproteobacteria bacterium]
MNRITNKFNELREKERIALVTYITAGDPSLESTEEIVLKLEESGADIIELGIPFSDPMADGPAIQLASERALESGTTLRGVLDTIRRIRRVSQVPIILFGYFNPFFHYGLKEFSEDAAKAGADGVLVVDLPPEEAAEFKVHTDKAGLDLVFLLAPTSTTERVELVASHASGFVYLVSVTGVTGVRPDMNYSLDTLADQIKSTSGLPVGVGFGVSSAEQVEKIAEYADAVIVGSAIVRIIEQYGSNKDRLLEELSKFINGLSGACNKPELKMKEKAQ